MSRQLPMTLYLVALAFLATALAGPFVVAQEAPRTLPDDQSQEAPQTGDDSIEPHEDLDALLWIQTSAEYAAITRQTFRLARLQLGDALVDPAWTASLEQQGMLDDDPDALNGLPPAIIVDVDETVTRPTRPR